MRTLHLLRGLALGGIATLIAKLLVTGQMALYMAPALDPLTALTGVLVGGLALSEFWAASRAEPAPRDEHTGSPIDQGLTLALVLLPVSLGLLVTPRALDSSALGGDDLARLIVAYPSRPQPIASAEQTPELFAYLRQTGGAGVGQRVRGIGLVARGDSLAADEFVLLRYSIVHCVADARPVGVLVIGPQGQWQRDQWVEIDGALDVREQNGDYLVALRADSIIATDEPTNPYLPAL